MKWIKWLLELFKRKPDVPGPVETQAADDLQIDGIVRWLGPNFSGAQLTGRIVSASMDNRFLYTGIEPYQWPRRVVGGVECDAQCCIFYYRDGRIVGGKFDFHRTGGQPVKTLENLHHGYAGHTMPEKGGPVWTMNASVDGKFRTNIKAVTWK
jgi:hypothetical protein